MSPHHSRVKEIQETPPPFALKSDGSGVGLTWKGFAAVIGFVAVAVAAWVNLKADVNTHTTDLATVKIDLKAVANTVALDHDTITKIDAKLDTVLREQRLAKEKQ